MSVTGLVVTVLPPAAAASLILAGCVLRRPVPPAIRVPAQAGPPESRITPTPGAAP